MKTYIPLLVVATGFAAAGDLSCYDKASAANAPRTPMILMNIEYMKDDRVGVCYAYSSLVAYDSAVLTAVPCDKVERLVAAHRTKD